MYRLKTVGMFQSGNIQKWYRGFDRRYGDGSEYTPHLKWLTDDIEYAKEYARNCGKNGAVMVYEIDFSKCNGSIYDLPEDVDYYDGPDEETCNELLSQGINSYCFYANNDSSYCMCLWSKEPIVGEPHILDMRQFGNKTVRLNEAKLRKIISESIKKVLCG